MAQKVVQNKKNTKPITVDKKEKPAGAAAKKENVNKEFTRMAYLFIGLFLAMMVYFVYFMAVRSENFINSPYNVLQDLFSAYVVRGEIQSSDGHVLAKTVVREDGSQVREYPYGRTFAHVVGFATNGKAGLENQANFSLLRSHAFIIEQITNELTGEKNIGDNIVTTLNFDLQNAAYEALGGYDGAVIVMEPATGKILAMVSKPDYNPGTIAADWESVTAEGSTVLFNRATQGQYAPGSVFKIFTTLEYFRENPDAPETYSFTCEGEFEKGGKTMHCAGNQKHGEESFTDSFANSCNCSYSNMALTLNRDKFMELCNGLLFNQNLPIAFESGKSTLSIGKTDSDAFVMDTGIGQGKTLVSPLHMLLVTSAIANDGVLMRPYLIERTENYAGTVVNAKKPQTYGTLLSGEEAYLLQEGMREMVKKNAGGRLDGQPYVAYGKTGTAQVSDSTSQTNSWFVGYIKMEGKPDIAIAVVAEDSESGGTTAVPIAKRVFDTYCR